MALVERDRSWIGRLEEGREMFSVDDGQALVQQFTTESGSLTRRVNAQSWQIPMRGGRMRSVHLFQHRKCVLVSLGRDTIGEELEDRV